MPTISLQSPEDWTPPDLLIPIGTIDRTPEQVTDTVGWPWVRDIEPGLGPVRLMGLAYDGQSRYVLMSSDHRPNDGIVIEADASVDPWLARFEVLRALRLTTADLLSHSWLATWVPSKFGAGAPAASATRWRLWRQDDHGNRFIVRDFTIRKDAEEACGRFNAGIHHQHYWLEVVRNTDD